MAIPICRELLADQRISAKLVTAPVIHDSLPFGTLHPIDPLVLIVLIVVEMTGRYFFKYTSLFGRKTVPHARLNQASVAGVKDTGSPLDHHVENSTDHLKCFFLELVIVLRVCLAGKLDNDLFAVFPIDDINQDCAHLLEIFHPVVVRIFDIEVSI